MNSGQCPWPEHSRLLPPTHPLKGVSSLTLEDEVGHSEVHATQKAEPDCQKQRVSMRAAGAPVSAVRLSSRPLELSFTLGAWTTLALKVYLVLCVYLKRRSVASKKHMQGSL